MQPTLILEIQAICNRLLDSEEHAGESAIPQVAEDAVELLNRLAGSIAATEKVKLSLVRGGTSALADIAAGNITDEVLYQFHEFEFNSQAEADAFLLGASTLMGCHEYLRPNEETLKQILARQSSKHALQKLAQEAFAGKHLELLDVLNGIGCPEDLLVAFKDRVSTPKEAEYRMDLLTHNPSYEMALVLFLASLGEFGRMESPEEFDEFCKLHGFPYTYRSVEMSAVTQ